MWVARHRPVFPRPRDAVLWPPTDRPVVPAGRLTPSVDRALAWSGVAGAAVAFGAIALTTTLAPWFGWTTHALSHLGEPNRWDLFWVFNWGLAVAGVLGTVFAVRVALDAATRPHAVAALATLVGMVALSLVGVFHLPHPLHGPVSVAFFVALTLGVAGHGVADVLAGRRHRGLGFVLVAVAHVGSWVAWVILRPWPGIALPELLGAVVLAGWALAVTRGA